MALPATHVRFALDLSPFYQISDMAAYISGTLYPDSRMITGVSRETTHSAACLEPDFPVCDFTLGWHVHCCCDHIQESLFTELIPHGDPAEGLSRWVFLSSAKMIQDMNDAECIDRKRAFSLLSFKINPYREAIDDIMCFNEMIRSIYQRPGKMTAERYYELWVHAGISEDLSRRLVLAMQEMAADATRKDRIQGIYPEMLRESIEGLNHRKGQLRV